MRRLGVAICAVLALWAGPAAFAEDGSCSRSGGGTDAAHPGVVLGPATKCVRDTAPAGVTGTESEAASRGPVVPVAAGTAVAVALAAFTAREVLRRRRDDAELPLVAAAPR